LRPTTCTIKWTISSVVLQVPGTWIESYSTPAFTCAGFSWKLECEPARQEGGKGWFFLWLKILSGKTLAKARAQIDGSDSLSSRTFFLVPKGGDSSMFSVVSPPNPMVLLDPPESEQFKHSSEVSYSNH